MTSTTMLIVKPAGPTAPRIAPEADAAMAAATFHARASVAFAAARSAGVNDESVYADQVACAPYMNAARRASASTASRTSPVNAAARANGSDASSTAATART